MVGPRQSGKTTLVLYLFPRHKYLSMENLDIRHMAQDDPRGFFDDNGKNLILDEIQRVSSLFSYIQKRIVKTPKLYFTDTGVLSFLLSIRNPGELKRHPLFGSLFETFIASKFYKRIYHTGKKPLLYFWRDKNGNEIDLVLETG